MRKIFKIALTELYTLFYSPIAWLILIIFTVQACMTYFRLVDIMLMQQFSRPLWYSIAKEMYTGSLGLFPNMLVHLYLYIPLLTMGLMSREYSSGSIKLLYSSPVSSVQIIFGKFLSMMIYSFILVGILFLFVGFTAWNVPSFDMSLALSGLLGIYLVICSYAAIGLFMSSLTSYQVVAAVATLGALAFLNYVGRIGQEIPFVLDITYWLSISGRSDELINGLISSEDVFYFLIVIGLFLTLSIMVILSGKCKLSKSMAFTRYAGVIVLAMLLGYVTSRPGLQCSYDASLIKQNSLNPVSQEIMEKMEGGLTITTYVNLLEGNFHRGAPAERNRDASQFKKFIRFKPKIRMNYVYYYADAGNEVLEERFPDLNTQQQAWKMAVMEDLDIEMFLAPEQVAQQVDLSGEKYRFVRLLERESGEKTFLRIFDDSYVYPKEGEIATAMKRLVTKAPKVAFLTGHGERDIQRAGDRDYYTFAIDPTFRYSLINQGFDVESITLSGGRAIPTGIDVLVIADLQQPLSADELARVEEYIAKGGNIVIGGEPGKSALMNPLTASLGVRFLPGTLVQPTKAYDDNLLVCSFTEEGVKVVTPFQGLWRQKYGITMPGAAALSYETGNGFDVYPLLKTQDAGSWNELTTVNFMDEKAVLNPEIGEKEESFPTMLALTRTVGGREQRVFVMGDVDCISNAELLMSRVGMRVNNFSLISGMFRWLSDGEYPIVLSGVPPVDTVLELNKDTVPYVRIAFTWGLPILFALGYFGVWFKRRRR